MKLCPGCFEEYEDCVDVCECGQDLVPSDEVLHHRPDDDLLRSDEDTTLYVTVGSAENQFEADALVNALREEEMSVLARKRRSSSVDALVESVPVAWWEILVPSDKREKAVQLIASRRILLESGQADAENAAVEDEIESEKRQG